MQKIIKELIIKIKNNGAIIILGGIVYLLGIVLGLIFSSSSNANFYEEYAINFYSLVLLPSSSAFAFLLKRIFNLVLLFIPLVLLSFNKFTNYFNFIFVFYKGFVLSISLKCLFLIFGFSGIFLFIFLSLIQSVTTTISIILFILLISANNCVTKKQLTNYIIKVTLISITIALLGLLVEFFLIISILRPFNFYF